MGKTIMTIKELGLTVRGVLALFWPWVSVKPFANDDVDAEVQTNQAFARMPKLEITRYRLEYETQVRKRLATFRWGVWRSFLFLLTAIMVAMIFTIFAHASPTAKVWLGALSMFVFAWATLARLGREATSFGGTTALERIDLRMLWIFYWIGTVLGTLALV
jgi:hypothetical protein